MTNLKIDDKITWKKASTGTSIMTITEIKDGWLVYANGHMVGHKNFFKLITLINYDASLKSRTDRELAKESKQIKVMQTDRYWGQGYSNGDCKCSKNYYQNHNQDCEEIA